MQNIKFQLRTECHSINKTFLFSNSAAASRRSVEICGFYTNVTMKKTSFFYSDEDEKVPKGRQANISKW